MTMKIGREHLTPAAREEITSRRAVWGTDVYTDDSDVIAACIHAGWIRGEWPEEVDVDLLGLDEGFHVSDIHENGVLRDGTKNDASGDKNLTVLTAPPSNGPMMVPEGRDLHVTLLILPTLERYASTTRFGIKSREWGGPAGDGEDARPSAKHDGISFMITEIRWVTNGGASQNRLRGKARRERIRKALREVALGPAWAGGVRNTTESRDSGSEKSGEVTGGWWKSNLSKPPSESDKENLSGPPKHDQTDKEKIATPPQTEPNGKGTDGPSEEVNDKDRGSEKEDEKAEKMEEAASNEAGSNDAPKDDKAAGMGKPVEEA